MNKYHKIQSIFKRDPDNGYKFTDAYSKPEFGYLANNLWVGTEKIDGRNHRIIWDGNTIKHKGRTDKAQMPKHLMESVENLVTPEYMKRVFGDTEVCLYGEAYGHKIQKVGHKYLKDGHSFILFDIKIGKYWLEMEDVIDIGKKLNIDVVPIIGEFPLQEAIDVVAEGFNSSFGDFTAEGLILKPKIQLFNRMGRRIITKVKHKDFN